MTSDSTEPAFWDERYASQRTPWALADIPPALDAFLRRCARGGSVLIPGCGADDRVIRRFLAGGFQVTAIDFSPVAIEQAGGESPDLSARIILGDFFTHRFGQEFDLIYERTFLCSLPPSRWRDYATRMAELVRPGGRLLGIFLYGSEPDPPPFPMTKQRARALFETHFELELVELLATSLPVFAGMEERWQQWVRKA